MKTTICILVAFSNIASHAAKVVYPPLGSTEIPKTLTVRGAWNAGQSNGHIRLYEHMEDGSRALVAERREARLPEMRIPSENSRGRMLKQDTKYSLEFQDAHGHQHTAVSEFWTVTTQPIITMTVEPNEVASVGDNIYGEVHIEERSGAITSFQWSINGSAVPGANGESFEHLVTSAGVLTVSCTAMGPGGKWDSEATALKVVLPSPPRISLDVEEAEPLYVGDRIVVYARSEEDSPDIEYYEWNVDGVPVTTEEGGVFEYVSDTVGPFTVTCVAVGYDGQRGSASVPRTAVARDPSTPRFALEIEQAADILEGDVVIVRAVPEANTPGILRYEWAVNGAVAAWQTGPSFELIAGLGTIVVTCRAIGERGTTLQSISFIAEEWAVDGDNGCEFSEEDGCDSDECDCGDFGDETGTNLILGNSVARLGLPVRDDGELTRIPIFGEEGRSYRVEASSDLKSWTEVEIVIVEGGKAEAFDFTEGAHARFFRAYEVIFTE